ncbi:MAG: asparagine synthetase B [Gammaproteobacteria bacterium]|nr:MAG: asparagine synthetase B [Gammaproteobacteria bacterium]
MTEPAGFRGRHGPGQAAEPRPPDRRSGPVALWRDGAVAAAGDERTLCLLAGHVRPVDGRPAAAWLLAQPRAARPAALARLDGGFALALYDGESLLLAVDRMGIGRLFWHACGDTVSFATRARALVAMLARSPDLSEQALYEYFYFHVVPGPTTVYRDVARLEPGGCLQLDRHGWRVARYWRPRFAPPRRADRGALAAMLREHLAEATRGALTGAQRPGGFLSGGTDSSSVCTLAQRAWDEPFPTFSIAFAAEGFDESAYARLVADRIGSEHHHHAITPADVVEAAERLAVRHDQPFGNASALPTYQVAKLARAAGVDRLLAGDGGDELFGGNARYAKQALFEHYQRLPAPLRARLDTLADALPAGAPWPLRKLRRYVEQARLPMPDRMEGHNLLLHFGAATVFTPDFLAAVDPLGPLARLRAMYRAVDARNTLDRQLGLDWKLTLADNDLVKVGEACAAAGVEVRYPMLAAPLVELATRLPPRYKLAGRRLRPFFKWALREVLPPAVRRKRKHGFGLPIGRWTLADPGLRALVGDHLQGLKRRGIVQPAFIDRLFEHHLPAQPDYYGVMVWLLAALELWLRARPVDAMRCAPAAAGTAAAAGPRA